MLYRINSEKNILSAFLFFASFVPQVVQAQLSKNWDKDFGGTGGGNNDQFTAALPTPDGGYLAGGSSNSNHSFVKTANCKGNFDFWIVKIDANGNRLWDKTFGGTNEDFLHCISITTDGGYLLGGSSKSNVLAPDKSQNSFGSRDFWIVKIDANGNRLWDKTFGGTGNDELRSITATSTGFILGGFSDSNLGGSKTENSKGLTDYWIISIDKNGNKLWDKTLGGNSDDYLFAMLPYSGGLLLAGSSYSGISSDKSQPSRGAEGNSDYWVIKIGNSGAKVWDITVGGFGDETLNSMITTRDGGVLLAGHSFSGKNGDKTTDNFDPDNTGDFWVANIFENALQNGAVKKWDKSFGGTDHDLLFDIIGTRDGNYLLAGASVSAISGNKTYANKGAYDYWIVKMDTDGNKIWDAGYGGTNNDYSQKIMEVPDGYILGGYSQSGINGDKSQNTLGSNDYWILKLRPASTFNVLGNYPDQDNFKVTTHSFLEGKSIIYPNPATRQITLTAYALENTLIAVSIINSLGVTVYTSSEISTGKSYAKTIDISNFPAGIYSVRINKGTETIVEKLLIEK